MYTASITPIKLIKCNPLKQITHPVLNTRHLYCNCLPPVTKQCFVYC